MNLRCRLGMHRRKQIGQNLYQCCRCASLWEVCLGWVGWEGEAFWAKVNQDGERG